MDMIGYAHGYADGYARISRWISAWISKISVLSVKLSVEDILEFRMRTDKQGLVRMLGYPRISGWSKFPDDQAIKVYFNELVGGLAAWGGQLFGSQ
jgi:hypothetical protein